MPELIVNVNETHLDEVKVMLEQRYGASVSQIIHTEWEGVVNLAQLRDYYEGEYRQDECVQALIASGRQPMPASEMTEDDWSEFAGDLELYEQNGDLQLFRPCPRYRHDYQRWFRHPDPITAPPEPNGRVQTAKSE